MIKLENTEVMGWEGAIRGMRNPMNSWAKSDSVHGCDLFGDGDTSYCCNCSEMYDCSAYNRKLIIGPNDYDLMMRLAKGGPVHAKYRRQIFVSVDITAPLYWWKEFDTYKVGTTANSCSTMHKIHAKEFTLEDFSCEHLLNMHSAGDEWAIPNIDVSPDKSGDIMFSPKGVLECIIIPMLNDCRNRYLETKDKKYWWQMIQLLPSSYNQMRTVTMTYENLYNMYHSRKDHKLDEWRVGFCGWIESLPYSEVITGHKDGTPVDSPVSYKYSASINGQLIEGYTTAGENATDDEIRRAILDTVCEGLSYEKN